MIYTLQREKETTFPNGFSCNCELCVLTAQTFRNQVRSPQILAVCQENTLKLLDCQKGRNQVRIQFYSTASRRPHTWKVPAGHYCCRGVTDECIPVDLDNIHLTSWQEILIDWCVITYLMLLCCWGKVLSCKDNCESNLPQMLNSHFKKACALLLLASLFLSL